MADPVVTNMAPAPGVGIGRNTALEFDITDPSNPIIVALYVKQAGVVDAKGNPKWELVFDDDLGFNGDFLDATNKRTGIADGYHFRILRVGGWLGVPLTIDIKALDSTGGGGGIMNFRTVSADFMVAVSDKYIEARGYAVALNGVMPSAAAAGAGNWFEVKDAQGVAGTHNITLTPDGTDTIDNGASKTIAVNYGALRFTSDGISNWDVS